MIYNSVRSFKNGVMEIEFFSCGVLLNGIIRLGENGNANHVRMLYV